MFDGGFALEITGFSTADLDFSLPDAPKEEGDTVELPFPAAVPVSRPGDLWQIGDHRLLCGDARDVTSYEALLGGDRADMVFADGPYNVRIDGHVSGLGEIKHREFSHASGEMSPPEFTAFQRTVFRNLVRFSKSGSIHFRCMDWRHIREMLDAADGIYDQFKQLIVWNKRNGAMGTFYRSQHELIFVFNAGSGRHKNNFGLGDKGRYRTNVWDYAGANAFRKGRQRDLADFDLSLPRSPGSAGNCEKGERDQSNNGEPHTPPHVDNQ